MALYKCCIIIIIIIVAVCQLLIKDFLILILSNAADKQTNRQTVSNLLPTPTYVIGVGNENISFLTEVTVVLCEYENVQHL